MISLIGIIVVAIPLIFITILLFVFNKGAGAFFTQTRTGRHVKLFKMSYLIVINANKI
jgi:undecaprenyl phosphate N,N'-diacetylbacillosamine 1-phosphate transferase